MNDIVDEDFSRYNGEGTTLRQAQNRLLEILLEFDRICKKHDIQYFLSGGSCLGAVRHGGFIPWDDDVDIDVWHTDYRRLEKILPQELSANRVMQTAKTDKGFYIHSMRIVDVNSAIDYGDAATFRNNLKYHGLFIDVLPLGKCISYTAKRWVNRYIGIPFVITRVGHKKKSLYLLSIILWPLLRLLLWMYRGLSIFAKNEKISHYHPSRTAMPKLKGAHLFPPEPILFEGHYLMGPANPEAYLTSLYGDYMAIPEPAKRETHTENISVF